MKTEKNTNPQNFSVPQATAPGDGDTLFFAGIMYTGNNQLLHNTLNSVFRQKAPGIKPEVYIFHAAQHVPAIDAVVNVRLVSFQNEGDFFSKYTDTVNQSAAQYCVTLWSGEEFFDGAFDSVEKIFSKHAQVNWLTGIQTFKAKEGFNITLGTTAMRRWSYKIYERNLYKNSGRYIPPASTFWRKSVWSSIASELHFVSPSDFCEDLWLAFFKTQKLYTCKAYFSSSVSHEKLNAQTFKTPNSFYLVEDHWLGKLKEFFFINNIPYLRLFYRNEIELSPLIRFDYETQSYYLSEY